MTDLRAPFPWFGGKSRVAPLVWDRFGDVPNYVEPFFGSGAVLLGYGFTTPSELLFLRRGLLHLRRRAAPGFKKPVALAGL